MLTNSHYKMLLHFSATETKPAWSARGLKVLSFTTTLCLPLGNGQQPSTVLSLTLTTSRALPIAASSLLLLMFIHSMLSLLPGSDDFGIKEEILF